VRAQEEHSVDQPASHPSRGGGDSQDQVFERSQPYHFTPWQRARLLVLRGRAQDGKLGGDLADDLAA
jgi:hypothetical protein